MAPGSSRMETPAMVCETGSCLTVASLAEPPGPTQPVSLSISYLKGSSSSALVSSAGAAFTCSAMTAVAARPSETLDMALNSARRSIPAGRSIPRSSGMGFSLRVQCYQMSMRYLLLLCFSAVAALAQQNSDLAQALQPSRERINAIDDQ